MSEEQQNQPGIVGELVEGLHNLEQKVEHLVHPDLPVINDDASALAAVDAARAEGFASHHEVAELTADESVHFEKVMADPPAPNEALQSGMTEFAKDPNMQEAGGAAVGESAGDAESPQPSDYLPPAAAPAPKKSEAASQADAQSAENAGIVGVIDEDQTVAGNIGLAAIGAASTIKAHIDAIRRHLSLRGFEMALMQDIHNELAAIERLL